MATTLRIQPVNHDGGARNDDFSVFINENIGAGTRVAKITGWESLQGPLTFAFHRIGTTTYDGEGRYVIERVTTATGATEYYLTVAPGKGGPTFFDFEDGTGIHGEVWVDVFGPASTTNTEAEGTFDINLNDLGNGPDDEPGVPILSIAPQASASQSEGNSGFKEFKFTVTRTGDTTSASDVDWKILTGTGTEVDASDFEALMGTVHFNAGQQIAEVVVRVRGDVAVESNENFTVVLLNPQNGGIASGSGGMAQGTIQDDDGTVPNQAPSVEAPTAVTGGVGTIPTTGTDQGKVLVNENAGTGALFDVNATDQDGTIVSYALSGTGLPAGAFTINGTTGTVSVDTSKLPAITQDTTYTLRVTATDNEGGTGFRDIQVVVKNNVNEAPNPPTYTSNGAIAETVTNGTVVGTLAATDPNGTTSSFKFVNALAGSNGLISSDGAFEIVGNQIKVKDATKIQVTNETSHTFNYQVVSTDGALDSTTSTGVAVVVNDVPQAGGINLTLTGPDDFTATDSGPSVSAFGGLSITGGGELTLRIAFNEEHGVLENIGSVNPTRSGGQFIYEFRGTKDALETLLDNLKFNPFNRAMASNTPVTTNFNITLSDANDEVTNNAIDVVTQIIGNHAPIVDVTPGAEVTKIVDTGPDVHPLKGLTLFDDEHDVLTMKVKFLKDHGNLVIPDGIQWTRSDVSGNDGVHYWEYTFTGLAAALEVMMDVIKFDSAPMPAGTAAGTVRATNFDITVTDGALGRDPVHEHVQVKSVVGKAGFASFIAPREFAVSGTKVGDLTAKDADNNAFSYQIVLANGTVANTDGRFKIGADGKSIEVADGFLLDYEQLRSHNLKLKVTIADGDNDPSNNLWFMQDVTINVENVSTEVISDSNDSHRFVGGTAADRIYGNGGNDTLNGGAGKDMLNGGIGNDTFMFTTAFSSKNTDKIVGYNAAQDRIFIENSLLKANKVLYKTISKGTETKAAALASKFFTIGPKAKDKDDFFVFDSRKYVLYYDADGSGSKAGVAIATFDKNAVKNFKHTELFFI
ncbi:MAG TPA: Calx-beta domain-containing protein [Microvirga sp.]|nr:Calx-beta domain-containing protein [Microvirga sp.]